MICVRTWCGRRPQPGAQTLAGGCPLHAVPLCSPLALPPPASIPKHEPWVGERSPLHTYSGLLQQARNKPSTFKK